MTAATPASAPVALPGELSVLSAGIDRFDAAVTATGAPLVHLQWRPPAGGDTAAARTLADLTRHPTVEAANGVALARYLGAEPVLVAVTPAARAIAALAAGERRLLHAGPPIEFAAMCGPMRGALAAAAVFEGWAADLPHAEQLLGSGRIAAEPCHHHGAVGPMAGVISPSMPLWEVHAEPPALPSPADGAAPPRRVVSWSNLNEGLGAVLRFGATGPEVLARLAWMSTELGPLLADTIARHGPLPLRPLMAQALHMGDEVHNRNGAATGLLLRRLLPSMLSCDHPADRLARVAAFIAGNDHFFLNLSMAACKALLDSAAGVPGSSMVTAMARNGVNFGIRLSGTGPAWFEAPASAVEGLYFAGYGPADANPDLGDSAITETAGLGGFAMAAAPAIAGFVGGTPADTIGHSIRMREITLGANPAFTLPALNFAPTAAGIDARAVVDTSILPVINTGIAHRQAGVGQIGAGITTAPLACFTAALSALHRTVDRS